MNVKLLEQVRDHIVANPEEYNQGHWCGTQHCIAGHTVVLAGVLGHEVVSSTSPWGNGNGLLNRIPTLAQGALELNDAQADKLFFDWPSEFRWASVTRIPDPKERAQMAAKK